MGLMSYGYPRAGQLLCQVHPAPLSLYLEPSDLEAAQELGKSVGSAANWG